LAITGVILGLLTPAVPLRRSRTAREDVRWAAHESLEEGGPPGSDAPRWQYVADVSREAVSPLGRVEHALHPWTSWVVLPVFALANAGVGLRDGAVDAAIGPVGAGILLGLVVGKPLGITGAVWLTTRLGLGRLPRRVTSRMILGTSALAGIGFTVALFISELGFTDAHDVEGAKLAVLAASLVAGALGALILASASRSPRSPRRRGRSIS
jgi:NhaA family Na+:H+ antiporter